MNIIIYNAIKYAPFYYIKKMEKHCTMVYFSLRESKQNKKGLSPIEVSISTNGERTYFSTGKQVRSIDWNKEKQSVKGKSEDAKLINDYLTQLRNKIYLKEIELLQKGYLITPSLLKEAVLDKVEALNEKTLLEVLEEHNTERKTMVGKTVAPATYWVFEYTGRLFKEFIQKKYERKDLYLREINLGFIQGFHAYLLGEKKMGQNSCTKHLKFLKKLLNLAVANSYISYNPVNAYKVEREPVDIDFLDEEELRKIINFDTPLPRLERAKDMFLFGCFTGLSYIDIKTLTPEHFEKDSAGRIWIKKRRVKTGVLSRIPLLPIAKLILDKYKGGEKLLPIQDPADINKYLKDIAILCGINKRICFHTSRHTFASTVTLANNISLEVVSKMLGHTNTRMTAHYAKLIDKCIGEQMDKLMDTFTGDSDY
jgi:integrase